MWWTDRRLAACVCFCGFATVPAQLAQSRERTYVDGEVIVLFRAAHAPSSVRSTPEGPSFGVSRVDSLLGLNGFYAARGFVDGYDVAAVPLARTFLVKCSPDVDEDSLCSSLRRLPEIQDATPNLLLRKEYGGTRTKTPPQSTRFGDQWYFHDPANDPADLDAPEAWAITRGSSDVVIAIHDTGIMVDLSDPGCYELHGDLACHWTAENVGHPVQCFDISDIDTTDSPGDPDAIADNVIGYNFAPHWPGETNQSKIRFWNAVPVDWILTGTSLTDEIPSSMNCVGMSPHGTRVASIAAGRWSNNTLEVLGDIVGLANECPVYIVRAGGVDDVSPARLSDEIAALTHAAHHARVINMSWGFSTKPAGTPDMLEVAIDFAANTKDCVLVSITHNQGLTNKVYWPAAYSNVLAVGAINKNLTLCSYSNYKSNEAIVDVVATVENGILTDNHVACTGPFGTVPCDGCAQEEVADYSISGTSFAAPQVSGVAALIRTRFPGLTEDRVRARIKRSAEYFQVWAAADSFKFGKGKVNAYRSVTEWGSFTGSRVWKRFAAGDTLVESRDGNYYISGDIVIEAGATLTIQADTVRVAPDIRNLGSDASRVEIIVKGTLKILGTSGDPVVFESFTDSAPTELDWVGIKFQPGSKGILQHVSIRNATQDVVVTRPSVSVSTWDEKKTLYLDSDLSITSDMTIATDEDLYVLGTSDVIVTAGGGVDLTVNGSLICKGVGTKKPEFRSSSGAPRSWGILTLSALSSGHTLHNSIIRDAQFTLRSYVPVTIDSCLIRSAVDGIQSYANVVVRNTTMHDFTGNALVWLAGNLNLKNLDVYNSAYGLHQSTATSTGTLTCRKVKFRDIDFRGIDVPSLSSGITIKQTTVRDATDGIYLAYQTSATVDSCELRANDIGISMLLSSGTSIRRCDVDSNTTAGVYLVSFTHTTMELDTIAHSPVGVYCRTNSNPSIQTSRLLSNSTGLKCESNANPLVRTTRIQSGTNGVLSLDGSAPDLGVAAGGTCGSGAQEGLNSVQNNTGYNVANFDAEVTVNAQCNWWGGTPPASKFYGNVVYTPYRSSDPNPAGSIDEPDPGDQPPPRVPSEYALHANRPNPFNPVTTIGYDVPAPGGRVDLAIYDVSGRLVRVLVASHRTPGAHSATWEGQDDRDTRVASGVYFVRMTAGSFAHTHKLVLLK